MRIVHFSDTHLGFQAYRTLDPSTGLNRRELDVYEAFRQAIDKIVALKPDAVLHSGDLFDGVRPSNRALTVAFEELRRLGEAGIPLVVISGNHSTPRVRGAGSIFKLFDLPEFPEIYPVYQGTYEEIKLGELAVHAVPQCLTPEEFTAELERVKPDPESRYNVLMLHASVAGAPEFSMGEFTEQLVPEKFLGSEYDYIALGHFHNKAQVRPHAFYAGSIERLTFNEVGRDKGLLEVDLGKKTVVFHPLELRAMWDASKINAADLDAAGLLSAIQTAVGEQKDAIVRLTVDNVNPDAYHLIDHNKIKELTKRETHLEIRWNRIDETTEEAAESATIGSLQEEFKAFMAGRPASKDKDSVLEAGLDYLDRAARERQ